MVVANKYQIMFTFDWPSKKWFGVIGSSYVCGLYQQAPQSLDSGGGFDECDGKYALYGAYHLSPQPPASGLNGLLNIHSIPRPDNSLAIASLSIVALSSFLAPMKFVPLSLLMCTGIPRTLMKLDTGIRGEVGGELEGHGTHREAREESDTSLLRAAINSDRDRAEVVQPGVGEGTGVWRKAALWELTHNWCMWFGILYFVVLNIVWYFQGEMQLDAFGCVHA